MNEVIDHAIRIIAIGAGATLVMDGWLMFLNRLGVPIQSFNLLGRWIGHWPGGVFRHDSIVKAAPVKRELLLGWLAHYAIGIAFVVMLVAVVGPAWLATPTPLPAIITGIVTVAAPLLVMQPALGAGIASTKTNAPLRNSLKSLANHSVFGIGLYLAAMAIAAIGA